MLYAYHGIEEFGQVVGAVKPEFLGVEGGYNHAALELPAPGAKLAGNLDEGGATGRIVVGTGIDLSLLDSEVIVMGAEHYVFVFEFVALNDSNHVNILLAVPLEGHHEVAVEEGLHAAFLIALDYVFARLSGVGATGRPPVERVGGKVINVLSESFASRLGA